MGRQYTREDVKKILEGLRIGPAHSLRPVSDASFERWCDLEGLERRRMMEHLGRIADSLEAREYGASPVQAPPRPAPPKEPRPTPQAQLRPAGGRGLVDL